MRLRNLNETDKGQWHILQFTLPGSSPSATHHYKCKIDCNHLKATKSNGTWKHRFFFSCFSLISESFSTIRISGTFCNSLFSVRHTLIWKKNFQRCRMCCIERKIVTKIYISTSLIFALDTPVSIHFHNNSENLFFIQFSTLYIFHEYGSQSVVYVWRVADIIRWVAEFEG